MKKTIIQSFLWLCFIGISILNGQSQTNTCTNPYLWGWGSNYDGQLGDGTNVKKFVPTRIGTNTDWKELSSENEHTAAIKSDGSLWGWGNNKTGQVGDGTTSNRSSPTRIGTGTDWVQVSAGHYHTVAIKSDGSLWAWGDNGSGQLGNGTGNISLTPVQIGTSKDWKTVVSAFQHNLALKKDGSLWGWGTNDHGQLGDGTNTNRLVPTRAGTATDWKQITTTGNHSGAIKTDGTLWTWGYYVNTSGVGTDNYAPEKISTTTDWQQISAGDYGFVALKTDGSLWEWKAKRNPIRTGTDTDWKDVSAKFDNVMALKTNGSLWLWSTIADVIYNTIASNATPLQVGTDKDWVKISAGRFTIFAWKCNAACNPPTVAGSNSVIIGSPINLIGSTTIGTATWSSSDTSIATVSSSGAVKGLKEGTVTISYKVTESSCTGTATKTITVISPTSCTIFPEPIVTVATGGGFLGSTMTVTITNLPAGASSSIDSVFTVGKTVYKDRPLSTFFVVSMKLNNCISQKSVQLFVRDFPVFDSTCIHIVNKATGKALTVESPLEGTQITQTPITGNINQIWNRVSLNYGKYRIVSRSSGKVIDAPNCAAGTLVKQYTADGTDSKTWRFYGQSNDGLFLLPNWECNRLMEVDSTSNITVRNGNVNSTEDRFKWFIQTVGCPTSQPPVDIFDPAKCYRIVNKTTKKVLEIKDASSAEGTQIYQWASTTSRKQQLWQIKKRSDGRYNIVAKSTGKLMDAPDCTEGGIIKEFAADGTNSQNWTIEPQADGSFKILNQSCNKYIRVEGGNAADGHEVGIKNDFGTDAFKWYFQVADCTTGAVLSATNASFGFEARASEGRAKLQWITNTGYKTDYFEVERLNTQGSFDVLGHQNAEGSNDMKSYTFTDNDPLDGDNFYRINSISQNGSPLQGSPLGQYSDLKKVSFSKNDGISIFPNPADEFINVDLRKYEDKTVALSIYNSVGLLVKKQTIEKVSAAPQQVDIQGFGAGSYLLRVQSEGKREVTRLFNIAK